MTILPEPIGRIPRPLKLIEAITRENAFAKTQAPVEGTPVAANVWGAR